VNLAKLARNLGLEEEEYMELIELFIQTAMSDLKKLQSAIEKGDAEQAINAAHSLNGAASNLGLIELSGLAKEIEGKTRYDRLIEIKEVFQKLKEKLETFTNLIRG